MRKKEEHNSIENTWYKFYKISCKTEGHNSIENT